MGVIAALGEKDTWKIQVRSALKNGELTGSAHGELLAGFEHHLAGVSVDEIVDGRVAAETRRIERHAPTRGRPALQMGGPQNRQP